MAARPIAEAWAKKRRGGAHRFHRHGCRAARSGGYCQGVARCCHGLAHRPFGNGISAAHKPQRPYATAARRTAERPRPVGCQHNRIARNRHNGRAGQLFGQQQLCNLLARNVVCGRRQPPVDRCQYAIHTFVVNTINHHDIVDRKQPQHHQPRC